MQIEKAHTATGHRAALYALAQLGQQTILSAGGDGWVVAWDIEMPEPGRVIADAGLQLYSLCALNETQLLGGNMNGGLHWIDLRNPENNRNIQHHQKGVFDILSTGDGTVWTAGGDGVLTRWDASAIRSLESLQLSRLSLRTLAFSPKRGELAVGTSDGDIYLLDAKTLEIRQRMANAHTLSVFTLAYNPEQNLLLSGGRDAMLRVWELDRDIRMFSEQPAHWFTINHLVFSPGGDYFATASRDKTIKIWRASDFQLLKVVDTIRSGGHINSVNRLLWREDYLLSCSDDRSIIWWKVLG